MALSLRNVALQKNVALLKCIKTRSVVTSANKNQSPPPISAATKRKTLREIFNTAFGPYLKKYSAPDTRMHTTAAPTLLYKSASCPNITYKDVDYPRRNLDRLDNSWLRARSATNFSAPKNKRTQSPLTPRPSESSKVIVPTLFETFAMTGCPSSSFSAMACPCPCPPCAPCGPCGPCCGNPTDCNCGCKLPPPCNTQPKCLQYMTGYYYYPYGTWFCGPYHVSTGGVPCAGPVCPGTPCGMAPPNPAAVKCGPCCKPCGCCCGLLNCTICNPVAFGSSQSGAWPMTSQVTYGGHASPQQGMSPPCPPILHGLPGDATQSSCGAGYSVNFSPLPVASSQSPCPTTPQWAKEYGPCKCADCVTKRNNNVIEIDDKLSKIDTPRTMKSILEPFSKAFPYRKSTNLSQESARSPKESNLLRDPKIKPSYN